MEALNVFMVATYEDLKICSLDVVTPLLHSLHPEQKFLIICVIVLFGI